MGYKTVREAWRSPTFAGQLIINMIINFGINFGFEWASLSKWGDRKNTAAWPALSMWKIDADSNSCLGMDMMITAFLLSFMCTLFATGGTQKEVREKKCDVLEPVATAGGWWPYTPVRYRGLCMRSFAMGLFFTVLAGVPTVLIMWMAIRNGTWAGLDYTIFKGIWCTVLAGFVYTLLFPAAIDKRNFPELEYEEMMQLQAASFKDDPPQMVANVGLI